MDIPILYNFMKTNNQKEVRMFVKIIFNEKGIQQLCKTVYFRNEMRIDFFLRWKWFFEYRAALLRVSYPKGFIELTSGPYEYILPDDLYLVKVRNRYVSNKSQLTKFKNKLTAIIDNWNELFPIEEDPRWIIITKKLEWYQKECDHSKNEYLSLFHPNDKDIV